MSPTLINPMNDLTKDRFDFNWDKKLSKHKAFEIQLTHWEKIEKWFDFNFGWTRKCDHCGVIFSGEILGWFLCLQIYDERHWNDEANRFYLPGEEMQKFEKQQKLEQEELEKQDREDEWKRLLERKKP